LAKWKGEKRGRDERKQRREKKEEEENESLPQTLIPPLLPTNPRFRLPDFISIVLRWCLVAKNP